MKKLIQNSDASSSTATYKEAAYPANQTFQPDNLVPFPTVGGEVRRRYDSSPNESIPTVYGETRHRYNTFHNESKERDRVSSANRDERGIISKTGHDSKRKSRSRKSSHH